ncbi:MAG: bifunctional riboflavin kinase/FAD synthetase [Chloroflexi bacterium]|nr:bifunctional riboflavin kinase/FAD synthetase [Chloroflexota bacterium]
MKILSLEEFRDTGKRSALALGFFDGVHRGHQKVLARAVELARQNGLAPVVFTFINHPAEITRQGRAPLLISDYARRAELISGTGIEYLVARKFDIEFSSISPGDFIYHIIKEQLRADFITVGRNYSFGRRAKGTPALLGKLQDLCEYKLIVEEPVRQGGIVISSSAIRSLISKGDLKTASAMLGRPFILKGTVIPGTGRGEKLGFPTANIDYPERIIRPPHGVFAVRARIDDEWLDSVANFGGAPTFENDDMRKNLLEIHVIDRTLNLYNKEIEVAFIEFLRPPVKFDDSGQLSEQIKKDCENARAILKNNNPSEVYT